MPTYEYACKACDHNFEIVQSFSEDSLTTCPSCDQDALRKVYNAAGIIFKGDGWHIKDYAASSSPSTSSSDDSSSASDSSTKSKGDTSKADTAKGTASTSAKKKSTSGGDGAAKSAAG